MEWKIVRQQPFKTEARHEGRSVSIESIPGLFLFLIKARSENGALEDIAYTCECALHRAERFLTANDTDRFEPQGWFDKVYGQLMLERGLY